MGHVFTHKVQLTAVKYLGKKTFCKIIGGERNLGTMEAAKSAFALQGQRDRFNMEQY